MRSFVIYLALTSLAFADGESEQVIVAAAKVRYYLKLQTKMPDEPPNVRLNIRAGSEEPAEPVEEEPAKVKTPLVMTLTEDPIVLEKPLRKIMWAPSWCSVCKQNNKLLTGLPGYTYSTGNEATFPEAVRKYANASDPPGTRHAGQQHGWPVWQIETESGQWIFAPHARTRADLDKLHKLKAGDPLPDSTYGKPQAAKAGPITTVRRLTASEIRQQLQSFRGVPWEAYGTTMTNHLTTTHGFLLNQLSGLNSSELSYLHGAAHVGAISPVVSEQIATAEPEQSFEARPPRTASQYGGAIHGRAWVVQGLDTFQKWFGDASVTFRWDRSGKQSMSVTRLMKGQPWTIKDVCGRYGHVEINTTSTNMPLGIQHLGFNYRLNDDESIDIDPDSVRIVLSGGFQASEPELKAMGLDPITIIGGLIQLVSILYQVLNPQLDLQLGGCVSADMQMVGDTLTMKFQDMPGIHASAWFNFDLQVQKTTLSPTRARLDFVPQPQNWIRIPFKELAIVD